MPLLPPNQAHGNGASGQSASSLPGDERGPIERLLSSVSPSVAKPLDAALAGKDITTEQADLLLKARGLDLTTITLAADELRRRRNGDIVTYVVNRNINFTNVCIKGCGFCAFSRDFREEQGYFLPKEEVLRRVREAADLGATEVCVQAGLPPKMEGDLYIKLCRAIKEAAPDIHVHGFSPEEVLYGAVRSRSTIREYLTELKAAGVGSLPGTSAEVLVQSVRDRISPGRITVDQWVEVITTAHTLGIPTTSTVMFGHVETPREVAEHMALIRDIQRDTGGITEFVPLSFVHTEAPMYLRHTVPGVRPGATGDEVVAVHAVARIFFDNWIPNIQASWVKEGPKLSQALLHAGANDLGGTLINESISTSAGASFGQLVAPKEFRRIIRDAGYTPAERTTLYKLRRVFENGDDPEEPLDRVGDNPEERFGSYRRLAQSAQFRYKHPRKADEHEFGRSSGQT